MTISSAFTVNGLATTDAISVSAGATVTATIVDPTGIAGFVWSFQGTDSPDHAAPTLTLTGSPQGSIVTFSVPADFGDGLGQSYLLECLASDGRFPQTSVRARAVIGVQNSSGIIPISANEEFERSATHGWTAIVNQSLAAVGTTGATGPGLIGAVDAVATSNRALTGTTSVDGVTLTANVSRVLLTAQTAAGENGPWVVQAGAWTRPTDFNVDAQVITGQNVFVKAGGTSIPANGQTWQLVSGSTIAGSKTYRVGTSSSSIAAVDIIATSNVASRSGTQTIDGISTAGKRILLQGQTAAAQNGCYLANASGAWTADFTADADVVAAVGKPVFVKPGGTSIPLEGQNWQLSVGSTIAGSKTYAKVAAVVATAPVDYVQQLHLGYITDPDWTYNSGTQTLTAAVNGAINSKIFGTADIVGKRLEVNYGGVADTRAGIYLGVSNGSGGTPASMVRASDFARSTSLVNGIRYLVNSGVLAGTQRAMATIAPVLDTTPILMDRVRPSNTLEVDLSAPPYNVRDYPSYLDWFFDRTQVDNGPIISQFLADYAGTGTVGRLPAGNGGFIICTTPILYVAGGPVLKGAGKRASTILGLMSGGPLILAQKLTPPQLSAVTVDSVSGSTAISFDVDTNGNAATPYWINLKHAGVVVDSWANFEYTGTHRWGSGGGLCAVSSCRGTRQIPNPGSATAIQDPLDLMFSLIYNAPAQQITAKLRLWDSTKGVYGAVTKTGGGTSVMTGDATIKPTADAPIAVRVKTGGTIGVTGIELQYSTNSESGTGITWSTPVALGTATSLTINAPTLHLEQGTWKFNFSAGTMVAGAQFYCDCTGTLQTITIVSDAANPVIINTNYVITLQYDGANVRLYCSKQGLARDSGSNATNHAATGVVRQYPWEEWMLGTQQNEGLVEGVDGAPAGPMYCGSVSILSSGVVAPPGTTPTTLTRTGAERFFFQPTTSNQIRSPDGILRAWHGFNKNVDSVVVPRSNYPVVRQQFSLGGFEDFGTSMGDIFGTNRMGMSLLTVAWNQRCFRNLLFAGGAHGWHNLGPDFFSDDYDLSYEVTWGPAHTAATVGYTWHGMHSFVNGGGPMLVAMANPYLTVHGTIKINCELSPGAVNLCDYGTIAPMVLYLADGDIGYLEIDPENQSINSPGRELLCVSAHTALSIRAAFASIDFSRYAFMSVASSSFNGQIYCGQTAIEAGGPTAYAFTIRDVLASPIKLGPDFKTPGNNFNALADRAGYVIKTGGLLPPSALTDANATLVYAVPNPGNPLYYSSIRSTYKMAAGTTTANRTLTLSTTDMQESDVHRVTLGVQANNVIFVNGGPAAGTLLTATAGFMGTLEFRLKQDGNLEWV